jgi:hypothetical protein
MRIHYVSFFQENDPAEQPLKDYLADLQNEAETELVISEIRSVADWRPQLLSLKLDKLDILMIGCHGHNSLTGFCVGDQPVRWHELASALKDSLSLSCSFIFYSCNGGYSGIAHMFYGSGGPDFLFGPYIHVDADAMKYSVRQIVDWKRRGSSTAEEACCLVNAVNEWAKGMYPRKKYDQSFLRVQWREGQKTLRHPTEPGRDRPNLAPISLKTAL